MPLQPIDIVDVFNRPTTRISDPEEACNLGLWHRGVKVVLYTPAGQVVAQERSANSIYSPSQIEMSAGGFVDSGETPPQAAAREILEETGQVIDENQLTFLTLTRNMSLWPYGNKQKTSRNFLYTYAYQLPSNTPSFSIRSDESSWIRLLPLATAQALAKKGRLPGIGKLADSRHRNIHNLRVIELLATTGERPVAHPTPPADQSA